MTSKSIKLSKKQKTTLLIVSVILLGLIVGLGVYKYRLNQIAPANSSMPDFPDVFPPAN